MLTGIEAAKRAGLQIKINTVALKGVNEDEFDRLIGWCGAEGFDLTFIEVMPMGEIGGDARLDAVKIGAIYPQIEMKGAVSVSP